MTRPGFRLLRLAFVPILLFAGTLLAAEEETFRTPPDFANRMKGVRTILAFRPDIRIFEITAGGVRAPRPEWCSEGCENVQAAVVGEFRKYGYDLKVADPGSDNTAGVRDVLLLYEDVVTSILLHAYGGPNGFPGKKANFDYTLGPIDDILGTAGADALLLIRGFDEISTSGRKTLQTLAVLAGALGGVVVTPNMGGTALIVGLVDRSGDILWFNLRSGKGGYNLRDPESVARIVSESLAGFQERRK